MGKTAVHTAILSGKGAATGDKSFYALFQTQGYTFLYIFIFRDRGSALSLNTDTGDMSTIPAGALRLLWGFK